MAPASSVVATRAARRSGPPGRRCPSCRESAAHPLRPPGPDGRPACGSVDPRERCWPDRPQQARGRFGHLFEQRLHFIGFVPLIGNLQDRLQPLDAGVLLLPAAHRVERAGKNHGQHFDRAERFGPVPRQCTVQQQQFAAGRMSRQRGRPPRLLRRRPIRDPARRPAARWAAAAPCRSWPARVPVHPLGTHQGGEIRPGRLLQQRQGLAQKLGPGIQLAAPTTARPRFRPGRDAFAAARTWARWRQDWWQSLPENRVLESKVHRRAGRVSSLLHHNRKLLQST